jgi:murein DD-endopeptidase MepM/ murein hydrolase activator NlpD
MTGYYTFSTRSTADGTTGRVTYDPHWGTDFACTEGADVYAVRSGTVVAVGTGTVEAPYSGSAKYLVLKVSYGPNGSGVGANQYALVTYRNLDSYTKSVGNTVTAGDKIGTVGTRGSGTYAPLHIEARWWYSTYVPGLPEFYLPEAIYPPDVLWRVLPIQGVAIEPPTLSDRAQYRLDAGIDRVSV